MSHFCFDELVQDRWVFDGCEDVVAFDVYTTQPSISESLRFEDAYLPV